ncbi:MAG: 6-phosphofructokinase [Armatimonadetes bacterium]|nr:6-phosphofructokinase [Armatimonadota bacterium]
MPHRVFLSYCSDNRRFACQLGYLLSKQPGLEWVAYFAVSETPDEIDGALHGNDPEGWRDYWATAASCASTVRAWKSSWPEECGRHNVELLERLTGHTGTALTWQNLVVPAIQQCTCLVWLGGKRLGPYQDREIREFRERGIDVEIVLHVPRPADEVRTITPTTARPIRVDAADPSEIIVAAREVVRSLDLHLLDVFGLPDGYPSDYEKDIIDLYQRGELNADERAAMGYPPEWPSRVPRHVWAINTPIPQGTAGLWRTEMHRVTVSARPCDEALPLTFPEGGPRKDIAHPPPARRELSAAILVSGGIAPGINAVIDGIVSRHELYHRAATEHSPGRGQERYMLSVRGYAEGFRSLFGPAMHQVKLCSLAPGDEPAEGRRERLAQQGGATFATSRTDGPLDPCPYPREQSIRDMAESIRDLGILYVIGGDGSMRAAHALTRALGDGRKPAIVAVPKTMDNDVLWVWQSFGFMSAVEKAKETLLLLHTEAQSNPRLGVVQLFGSDSGFVVSHAALASGVCDAALIPEVPFTMEELFQHVWKRVRPKLHAGQDAGDWKSPYGLIVMAETAIPEDAEALMTWQDPENAPHPLDLTPSEIDAVRRFQRNDRRVRGQTPDRLRTAGIKIVSRGMELGFRAMALAPPVRCNECPFALPDEPEDPYWASFRVFTNEPRHLIRAIPPSVSDVVMGQRLGTLAVDAAMAGYTDVMVSQWLTEYVLVPLDLVVVGRKRVPPDGMFWKSVLASTRQPPVMYRRVEVTGTAVRIPSAMGAQNDMNADGFYTGGGDGPLFTREGTDYRIEWDQRGWWSLWHGQEKLYRSVGKYIGGVWQAEDGHRAPPTVRIVGRDGHA